MNGENSGIFNLSDQETEKVRSSRVPLALGVAASMIIILAGIYYAKMLVGPALLALFLAVILLVPLRWLVNHGCPALLAYPIVLLSTVALFAFVTYFVYQSLEDFLRQIPEQRDKFVVRFAELETQFEEWVNQFGVGFLRDESDDKDEEKEPTEEPLPEVQAVAEIVPVELPRAPPAVRDREIIAGNGDFDNFDEWDVDHEFEGHAEEEQLDPIEEARIMARQIEQDNALPFNFKPATIAAWLAWGGLYLQSVLAGGFLVLLFTIFMLFEAANFPKKVNRAFGTDGPINFEHFHKIAEEVRRYLFLKTLSSLMSAVAAATVYWYFDVPGWLFWGIVAFFMYFIPNLGGTLAAIIPGILIFIAGGIYVTLAYAIVLLTVECAIAYGIEPKLLGHGMRLSVLVIILSLFFWGFLLGPIGLFLAAPLAVVIKIVMQAFPETRWLAVFLDSGREK